MIERNVSAVITELEARYDYLGSVITLLRDVSYELSMIAEDAPTVADAKLTQNVRELMISRSEKLEVQCEKIWKAIKLATDSLEAS